MNDAFDIAVIGSGPGGYHTAIRAAQLGKRVVCIDGGALGGVCVNTGCIPTKALLHVGEVAEQARHASAIGLEIPSVTLDIAGARRFAAGAVKANADGVAALLRANGVTFLAGVASFTSPTSLAIRGDSPTTLRVAATIVATGSAPVTLPSFPQDGRVVVDSDALVALPDVPPRLVVIGGGVVGLELATVYARFGAAVTVVERANQLLPGTDRAIATALQRSLTRQGIAVILSASASLAALHGEVASVAVDVGGTRTTREAERVLVAVGRRPVTHSTNLVEMGVKLDARGFVIVDAQRRSNVPGILAIGDVTGGPLVAHKAMREGVVAAEHLAGDRGAAFDPHAIPTCVYTDPQVASAGWSEEEATARGHTVRIGTFPLSASGRGRTMGGAEGLIKVVGDAATDALLGVHILGPQAESLIGEAVIALEMGATLEDLALSIHPHPTFTEAIHDAAELALGKAVHLLNRRPRAPAG